jgi:hypothetical protein
MTKRRDNIRSEIASLEAKLARKPRRQARRKKSADDEILTALNGLAVAVKQACGESFMEEGIDFEEDVAPMGYMEEEEAPMSWMEDEAPMGYMEEDMEDAMSYMDDAMDYMDYMDEDELLDDDYVDEDIVLAEDGPGTDYPPVPTGAEEEITQDYLDDVLEEEKSPSSIVTDPTIQDAAPGGYVANLKRASARLDRVAAYCEEQGSKKLAFKIDQIADAIDARIKKEAR